MGWREWSAPRAHGRESSLMVGNFPTIVCPARARARGSSSLQRVRNWSLPRARTGASNTFWLSMTQELSAPRAHGREGLGNRRVRDDFVCSARARARSQTAKYFAIGRWSAPRAHGRERAENACERCLSVCSARARARGLRNFPQIAGGCLLRARTGARFVTRWRCARSQSRTRHDRPRQHSSHRQARAARP